VLTQKPADIAIIGAGPYGLSLAAHLRPRGYDVRVFGDTMSMWRTRMPKGMSLKSEGFASSLYDPGGTFPLARYCTENGIPYADVGLPVALDAFTRYGMMFQNRFVPDVENRTVTDVRRRGDGFDLQFADGGMVSTRRVVVAIGVGYFPHIPEVLAGLPADLVSHSSHHHVLDQFAGRDVAVIGAGASAIDIAVLLHAAGANTSIVARIPELAFQDPPASPSRPRPLQHRLRWPRSGIGYGWKSYLSVGMPLAFRRLPESVRLRVVRSHLGPAPCWFTKDQVVGKVPTHLGRSIESAEPAGSRVRLRLSHAGGAKEELLVDHVVAGTGYRANLRRLPFLHEHLLTKIASVAGTPVLSANFESSVNGLYFVGPISANTFGPLSRFAFGANFATQRVVSHVRALH
jgi:thioredoxin reductase